MIPLTRNGTSRKLETTLVSYPRQRLPRPARLYSSPSKKANAPALATNAAPAAEYPPYRPSSSAESADQLSPAFEDMQGFLRRRTNWTILPTPLPSDQKSAVNDYFFIDTPTQNQVSVLDTCLHNLYDVPRARIVFERLRGSKLGDPVMNVRLYNSLLDAYILMAAGKEPAMRTEWLAHARALFDVMEDGAEKVAPTANTYALMLTAWMRYNAESGPAEMRSDVELPDATTILRCIVNRNISVSQVVSDRAFTSSEEASLGIRLLSKAAVELNLSKIVNELGAAELMGQQVDPLAGVPEVMPVLRAKKQQIVAEDGSTIEPDPEVPVEYEIPFNLEVLRRHLAHVTLARRVLPEDLTARQKLLEESVYDVAVERLRRQAELFEDLGLSDKGLKTVDLQTWMYDWHTKLQARLNVEIAELIEGESKLKEYRLNTRLGPFLSLIKPEKLSLITILELMHLQGSGGINDGMKTARALLAVGKAVEMEYKAEMCKKNNIAIPSAPGATNINLFSRLGYRDLHARRVAARKYMEDSEEWTADWTQVMKVRVGSFLVDALMDTATVKRSAVDKHTNELITEEQPAFFHSYEYLRGHKLGVIKLNQVVSDRMSRDALKETLHPRHLPMLVKPKPWLSDDQGGYIYNKTSAMRFKDSQEQQNYLRRASSLGNLELVYASLDVLGSTPWKINRQVFEIVLRVWNSGERLGKLPPAAPDIPEPEKPENIETDPSARNTYLIRQREYNELRANIHSDRCSVNYKIEVARTFLGDIIYLPHNVDFRGRAYPIPPHLNQLGDDLSRGLLKFAETKPLGTSGLRWLKIHLANLFGYDKGSFDERVEFVHNHLKEIYDSAENPLEGGRWWSKADDPWQCLATCMELRAALESGNPETFESSLPVHQDGTCNGLQHYAALGGDATGARQVNLGVTEKPSDVYTFVAEMVEKQIQADLLQDHTYAKLLAGKISRKVVKQTVMTTVYGVTFIGAREQIERQLKDRGDIPQELCWAASSYIAKITLGCIADLFKGAKAIQNWLNMCARLISKSVPPERMLSLNSKEPVVPKKVKGPAPKSVVAQVAKEMMTSVIWTTPLGLPIVQPYRKTKRKQIFTALQTVFISDPNVPSQVNSIKQASAFPPNFVHSLDATHMMLTALECNAQGLAFASVHDSYWTHAASIDQMSSIIRDTFIALHSSDVLKKLDEEFRERYQGYMVPITAIRTGSLWERLSANATAASAVKLATTQAADARALEEDKVVASARTSTDLSGMDLEASEYETNADVEAKPVQSKRRSRKIVDEEEMIDDEEMVDEEMAAAEELNELDEDEAKANQTPKSSRMGRPNRIIPQLGLVTDELANHNFVPLVDLLPPLPKKGGFDVTTIRQSLYFFS